MAATLTHSSRDLVARCMDLASEVLRLPVAHMWVDYDQEADVLYMSFRKPQRATSTTELSDDVLIRKDGKKVVGLTILNASISTARTNGTRRHS